jgi:hypothetical protein
VVARLAVGLPLTAALGLAAQWPTLPDEPLLVVGTLLVGLSFLTVGVLVSVEPGQGRVAATLAGAGVLWPLVGARAWVDVGPIPLLAILEGPLAGLLAAWGLLHYPTRWATRRRERVLLGLLAATQSLVLTVVVTAKPEWQGLPADATWLPAWPNQALFDIADILYRSSHGVLSVAVAVAIPLRIRGLSGPDRHIMIPLSAAVAVGALATALSVPVAFLDVSPQFQITYATAQQFCILSIPLAFLLAVLRRMFNRDAIWVLADRLRSTTDVDMVLLALREALTDPTLEIFYWMPATGGYVDTGGTPRQPRADSLMVLDHIRGDDGEPLALIVGDPALLRHPQLAKPAARALALSLANARLHAEIRAQIARVHHSQQRLPSVVAAERRRIEDDIAGGAWQKLQELGEYLETVLGDTGPEHDAGTGHDGPEPLATQALRTVREQLPVVQRELRNLARGRVPGELTESGLWAAVAAMAETLPLPVEVELPPGRFSRATEDTAYFMISEALANTVKHARASCAQVRGTLADGRLWLKVVDDGVGGADPGGSGLAGIAERVRASGGHLGVSSGAGRGTSITADLPR